MGAVEAAETYLVFEFHQVDIKQFSAISISFNSFKTFIILKHTHCFAEWLFKNPSSKENYHETDQDICKT